MLEADRPAFDETLASLFGAWGRTYSPGLQGGYWKGLARMQLSDLTRVVDRAIERFTDDPEMRLPDVGHLWAIKRSLRTQAPGMRAEDEAPKWSGDIWAQLANQHLLGYILRAPLRHYDAADTAVLVEFKNGWARDMRESAADGTVPADVGLEWWQSNMQRAAEQIARLRGAA